MDVPVALAIGLAFIVSCLNFFRGHGEIWFDSVVMFIFFLSLGRHIELSLRHRSLQAGTALARLMPEWAQRITTSGDETVPAADLVTGDMVRVAPGETFPADGVINSGTTEVDEALLTGESQAVTRSAGEYVVAGTVNLSQAVEVKVTASGDESTISALARLVLSAQTRRSNSAGLPSWLVPAFILVVLTLATATWFFWQQAQPGQAFSAALAVLVASCPCALSLALPAVYSAASHRLMMEGILLTRSDALHDLLRVDTVIFDKTGTLTRGYPQIQHIQTNPLRSESTESVALEIAAALEAHSIHPLARAFRRGSNRVQASAVTAHPAGGLEGMIDGHRWCIGNVCFMRERLGLETRPSAAGEIWLADEHDWYARFTLADALRVGSRLTLEELSASGLDVRILSGDAEVAVADVAEFLGVARWRAQQRADMKLQIIREMQAQGRTVLMVGDGANDGPVLAAADVSMTVQGATELANSSADFILTAESLQLVMRAFDISRHAAQLIRQNLVWALVYNAAVMPLAMSGALKPWMAALGMSASSLVVVLNATRLSRLSKRRKLTGTPSTIEMQLQ
jgi:Cu2+-exporting ATPase